MGRETILRIVILELLSHFVSTNLVFLNYSRSVILNQKSLEQFQEILPWKHLVFF